MNAHEQQSKGSIGSNETCAAAHMADCSPDGSKQGWLHKRLNNRYRRFHQVEIPYRMQNIPIQRRRPRTPGGRPRIPSGLGFGRHAY
jgi:hypothetical protein